MSMSAEEILINCEKQFSFLKKDIEVLISYINELLAQCKKIDNSNFFQQQINYFLEKLKIENKELIENAFEKEISSDVHVEIEKYHEIQRFAEKKRNNITDLKTKIFLLKSDIIKKEQMQIKKSLEKNYFSNILDLKKQLIMNYKDDQDKLFIKKLFEDKEHLFINKKKDKILSYIFIELEKYKTSNKIIFEEIISNSIELYKDDQDVFAIVKNEMKLLSENKDNENINEIISKYLYNSSKLAEQEVIRKDNVLKIVNAIRKVGYIVNPNNIRKIKQKNLIIIHGEKITGETADFAVRHDGSFIYNWEGFEGRQHDEDAKAFIKKLKDFNIHASNEFNKQYREPKYIAKRKKVITENNTKKDK
ncbi:transcriptional regulator [Spiroplasma taiwanense]|uniref:Uncharacterized protein n=1 Tax=Spiroplasma taiwanense CT-1 TaxID=1276220 RepID=S5MG72_9MOLU|nr:hypothetical protein [Spiroplasma taiwanense]AGR40855.1 hypothetical protein STAIW_v1c01780 [Spiroplasma taiwanense CT-1]